MRIAIVGGSFNPPHIGHLILAEEVLATRNYDKVLLIPANLPPHKVPQHDPGAKMRLVMLSASIEGWQEIIVEPCELQRQGISYTIDTLREIPQKYNCDGKPGLIIGDDLALDFLTAWKNPEKILDLADLIIAHRLYAEKVNLAYPHRYIDNIIIPISSSLVRERIAQRGAWRSLVMPRVRETIETHGLYRNT
ncbi:MAG: nicotinate (nicotinamide) nucleotide adenylyltransferase [Rectinema sp.]|jgi:nicotinate-nucleotide adenylyltransferase|uniref:Probable nicotinate-nucleotide adenylyltransferase n=1 Tax=uncultured spirochete TaxID=156406 RepID=A0A3P3XTY2_9SPIR|nr:putative nicotinate-nucleotide adenylyltransferase [uncultured spirochete]